MSDHLATDDPSDGRADSQIHIGWAWAAFSAGAALGFFLLLSEGSQWIPIVANLSVGLFLGGGGVLAVRYLRREAVKAIRSESLTADAKKLAGPTRSSIDAGDIEPPDLVSFEIEPRRVKGRGRDAHVFLKAHIVDDLSGVAGEGFTSSPTQVRFVSPSALQFRDGIFESHVSLVEGNSRDGRYETDLVIPQYSEVGAWRVAYFLLVDHVGNHRYLTEDELRARGFPTHIEVQR